MRPGANVRLLKKPPNEFPHSFAKGLPSHFPNARANELPNARMKCAARGFSPVLMALLLVWTALLPVGGLLADPVPVRHVEGVTHGFLSLSTTDGTRIADGEMTEVINGVRVTTVLTFRFKDGSLYEDTTVFTQRGHFQLISDRLVEKGPSFKHPSETYVDVPKARVTAHYTEDDGTVKSASEHVDLPPDVANGMIFLLLKDIDPSGPEIKLPMVVASPKSRVVKLAVTRQGDDTFSVGGWTQKAMHFVIKVEIGGIAGAVAPLVGKQPPDIHAWILGGKAPVFLRSEGPLYEGGPIWRIELTSPTWPQTATAESSRR